MLSFGLLKDKIESLSGVITVCYEKQMSYVFYFLMPELGGTRLIYLMSQPGSVAAGAGTMVAYTNNLVPPTLELGWDNIIFPQV